MNKTEFLSLYRPPAEQKTKTDQDKRDIELKVSTLHHLKQLGFSLSDAKIILETEIKTK